MDYISSAIFHLQNKQESKHNSTQNSNDDQGTKTTSMDSGFLRVSASAESTP